MAPIGLATGRSSPIGSSRWGQSSSGSPSSMKALTGVVVLGEALGAVGLARGALFRRGGDLGCNLGFEACFEEKNPVTWVPYMEVLLVMDADSRFPLISVLIRVDSVEDKQKGENFPYGGDGRSARFPLVSWGWRSLGGPTLGLLGCARWESGRTGAGPSGKEEIKEMLSRLSFSRGA
jgi:hypothetical protein